MAIRRELKFERLRSDWEGQKREFNQAVREGLILAGIEWKDNFLPMHFGPKAARRYGYETRSAGYLINKAFEAGNKSKAVGLKRRLGQRKKTRFNDTAPFERKGQLRRLATHAARIRATATSSKAFVTITVPFGHAIDVRFSNEITKLLDSEFDVMARIAFGHVRQKIDEYKKQSKQRVK